MPAFIKTPKQEKDWKRAKDLVHKQYPKIKEKNNKFWQLTNHIYQNMQPKETAECDKNVADMMEEDMINLVKQYILEHPEFDPDDLDDIEEGVCKTKK